jgi:hypothetical protein
MNNKVYVSFDNGVSGSIGIIYPDKPAFFTHTPVKKCLNYTKVKKWINRIDIPLVKDLLVANLKGYSTDHLIVGLERPMVNPGRFAATISAIRALEATLILLEELVLPYKYIDSKEWQKIILPSGLEGDELKLASKEVGCRLFPHLSKLFKKDADGILIAQYLKTMDSVSRTL